MPAAEQWSAILWTLGLGAGFVLVVYLIVTNAWHRKSLGGQVPDGEIKPVPTGPIDEFPEGLAEAHGRTPLILKLIAVAFFLWAAGYFALSFTQNWT